MPMDRRQFLKNAAACSLAGLALTETLEGHPSMSGTPCNCASILLHGLFFLEFQGSVLYAAAPQITGHQYFFRDHLKINLQDASGIVNLMFLNPNNQVVPFPKEMLQFSKTEIGQSGNMIDPSSLNRYKLVLQLPLPSRILPLRLGSVDDFMPDSSKKVSKSIESNLTRTGAQKIALVTCLQYDGANPFTWNFYAEHPVEIMDPTAVNQIFDEASHTFSKFDLKLSDISGKRVACDNDQLPNELDLSDETALPQLLLSNPILCPKTLSAEAESKLSGSKKPQVSVQVATCPQFGANI